MWGNGFHSCVTGVRLLGSGANTFLPYCRSVTSHLDLLPCSLEPWTGTCTRPCAFSVHCHNLYFEDLFVLPSYVCVGWWRRLSVFVPSGILHDGQSRSPVLLVTTFVYRICHVRNLCYFNVIPLLETPFYHSFFWLVVEDMVFFKFYDQGFVCIPHFSCICYILSPNFPLFNH